MYIVQACVDFRPSLESRSRFGSLNSGILLSDTSSDLPQDLRGLSETTDASRLTFAPAPQREAPPSLSTMFSARSSSPGPTSALDAPSDVEAPISVSASGDEHAKSIAIRAMRSMRSMASISGWSIKAGDKDYGGSIRGKKEGKKEKKDKVEGKKGEKERRSEDTDGATTRSASRSSYEPTASESEGPVKTERKSLEKKKSVLSMGLGWPGTLRSKESLVTSSPSVTSPPKSSTPPSVFETRRYSADLTKRFSTSSDRPSLSPKRLSSGSDRFSMNSLDANVTATLGRARAGSRSTMSSTNSSLRPLSTISGTSGGSSGSSATSVR